MFAKMNIEVNKTGEGVKYSQAVKINGIDYRVILSCPDDKDTPEIVQRLINKGNEVAAALWLGKDGLEKIAMTIGGGVTPSIMGTYVTGSARTEKVVDLVKELKKKKRSGTDKEQKEARAKLEAINNITHLFKKIVGVQRETIEFVPAN